MGIRRRQIANAVTLFRIFLILVFAMIAFQPIAPVVKVLVIAFAGGLDLVDGVLARAFNASSRLGAALDLLADKALTVTSCLYLAALGYCLFVLAIIAIRELTMLAARTLRPPDRESVLPTNRVFGGMMAFWFWTCVSIAVFDCPGLRSILQMNLIAIALVYVLNLAYRLVRAAGTISQ